MTPVSSDPAPRTRVVVHVGAPKTGTTYLQDRLAANVRELARHGVVYPLLGQGSHFRAALDLIGEDWGGQGEDVRGEWEALVADTAAAPDGSVVLLSHELLAGATHDQAARAVAQLEAAGCRGGQRNEVHVVYASRDLARQVPAEWQEGVKHRRKRSFASFTRRIEKAERGPGATMWFWRAQDLRGVLTRWGATLPVERLHLVTVPPPGAAPDVLFARYCEAFGIEASWAPAEAGGANTSIGTAETAMLRALNARLREIDFPNDAYRLLVRELVVHQTLATRPGGDRATIGADVHAWAAPLAQEWVEWVAEQGIDVVGDLADLALPAPGAERARAVDDPRSRDVADAAVTALVAVLSHAAEHDPELRRGPRARSRAVALRTSRGLRRLRGVLR